MSADAGALGRLAASVADGVAVDWSGVESDAAPQDRRLMRHLRLVESVAALYRSIPEPDERLGRTVPSGPKWGRLVLLDCIGRGTSGDVHRAFDTDLHRGVALKLLHEGQDGGTGARRAHDRILQEARRLARVRHPHVVQVLGAEQHNGRVGLWMELVEGESLDQMVRTRGTFGAREAAGIGQDLCSALAAVHSAGLLHRDVKAQNVLREAGGRLVLMDFGTGEELRPGSGTVRLVGTPLYLAPEIFEGRQASVQSDLYSVGVLLFHLVTGSFPVTASGMAQLAAAQGRRDVRRLRDVRPDLPSGFVRVVDRALDHDPSVRFQSAGAMEAALGEAMSPFQSVGPAEADMPAAGAADASWRPAVLVSLAATLTLVVGLIAWQAYSNAGAPGGGAPTKIAVLPFKDLSPTAVPFLADGLTDELIARLGQLTALRVTAPGSVVRYRNSRVPAAEIGRELGVAAVVEGTITSVRTAADQPARARVETIIRRAGSGAPLWSGSFDWVAGNSASLQAALTRAIARAVNVAVAPTKIDGAPRTQANPIAEQAYLRGRVALADYGAESSRRAVEAFQSAVLADSSYAAAYAGLSRAYVRLGQLGDMAPPEARQAAVIAARRALDLDPGLADAHRASADLSFFFDWDWATAESEYLESLDLNPSLSRARMNYAELLAVRQRFDDAFAQAEMARSLDTSSEVSLTYAVLLIYARRFDEADALLLQTLARQPNLAGAYLLRGRVAESRGRYLEAHRLLITAARLSSGGGVPLQVAIVAVQARAGRVDEARKAFEALEAQAAAHAIRLSDRDRAYVRLAFGDEAGACESFERALEERDWSLMWLGVDPRVDALHGNPRFDAILKRIGLM